VTEFSKGIEYSFTSSDNDDPNRFLLHFGPLGVDEPALNNMFNIYSRDGIIYVISKEETQADVTVSNMVGQLVLSTRLDGKNLTSISAKSLQNGIYLVNIVNGSQVVSRKVLVQN
jgi:hypothetical protein